MSPPNSLLDKAMHGAGLGNDPSPSSLLSRALAAREPVSASPETIETETETEFATGFDATGFEDLGREIEMLPPHHDSILKLWSLVCDRIPLAAIALFLPQDGFLVSAAQNGFPLGVDDSIPLSLASTSQNGLEPLDNETRALIAPILGVPLSLSLRASTMSPESDPFGLWVFHDSVLEESNRESHEKLGILLAHAADGLPAALMESPVADPARTLLDGSVKYASASAIVFDLSSFVTGEQTRFRGLMPSMIRSSFLAACRKILSQGGAAVAYDDMAIACILGSTSTLDPDLALFQFSKTLKRIMPYISKDTFPKGRVLRIDPGSKSALEDLSNFLLG